MDLLLAELKERGRVNPETLESYIESEKVTIFYTGFNFCGTLRPVRVQGLCL